MAEGAVENPGPAVTRRSRSRRNVVGGSPNRDDYVALMRAGWSSVAIERYAMYRHGEDIPASTIKVYRRKVRGNVWSTEVSKSDRVDPDVVLDILHERAELIRLQRERVLMEARTELGMGKLFNTTAKEIALLSQLLSDSKADLQDLGLFPKAGETLTIKGQVGGLAPDMDDGRHRYTPAAATLGELMGQLGPAEEARLARMLHDILPGEVQQVEGNGHVVVEGGADAG